MTATGNYITEADVDNWPSGYTESQKLAVIQLAEDFIERLTCDYFYAKPFSIVLNGNRKNQLFLGLVSNVLSVTEITISEVALSTGLFSFDENSVFSAALTTAQCKAMEGVTLTGTNPVSVNVTAHGFVTGETVRLVSVVGISPKLDGEYGVTKVDANNFTLNGTNSSNYSGIFSSGIACFATLAELHYLTDETPDGVFPKGTKNIKVVGTCGWASCPPAIKRAVVVLCRCDNDETLYTKYDDLASDSMGDASYSRGDKKFLTGIHEADRLIRNYIRKKAMLGAV